MSKLSFRAKPLDPSKPMPIYFAEELPDLPEYSAINRAVPQMPSGMEKEEESEHHLQRAICTGLIIPTPEVFAVDKTFIDHTYPADYKMPHQLIHMQPLGLEQDTPDYDMDSADEIWVHQQSRRLDLTPLKFEQMMDRLEKSSGQTVITLNEAKALLKQDDEISIAVYDYWLNKRLKTQHPLILSVKTENRSGNAANSPYLAFRRRTEKMQTRKNRKNDESSYEKMLKLRRDLSRAVTLLEMVKRREKTKREQLHLSIEIFEKRYQARDFSGSLLSELNATVKNSRPAFAPIFSNQYSHLTSTQSSSSATAGTSGTSSVIGHQSSSSLNSSSGNLIGHHSNLHSYTSQYLNTTLGGSGVMVGNSNSGSNGIVAGSGIISGSNKRDYDSMTANNNNSNTIRKEKRQYKKRKHKMPREKHHTIHSQYNLQTSLHQNSSPAIAIAIESTLETDDEDGGSGSIISGRLLPSTAAGTGSSLSCMGGPNSDNEDEGFYAFKRNKNCEYHKPLTKYGNWPWESKDENGSSDPKYRFTLTSIRHPRPRCIGFARRRVGRGGRILLDRYSTNLDDFWSQLDYTIIDNNNDKTQLINSVSNSNNNNNNNINNSNLNKSTNNYNLTNNNLLNNRKNNLNKLSTQTVTTTTIQIKSENDENLLNNNTYNNNLNNINNNNYYFKKSTTIKTLLQDTDSDLDENPSRDFNYCSSVEPLEFNNNSSSSSRSYYNSKLHQQQQQPNNLNKINFIKKLKLLNLYNNINSNNNSNNNINSISNFNNNNSITNINNYILNKNLKLDLNNVDLNLIKLLEQEQQEQLLLLSNDKKCDQQQQQIVADLINNKRSSSSDLIIKSNNNNLICNNNNQFDKNIVIKLEDDMSNDYNNMTLVESASMSVKKLSSGTFIPADTSSLSTTITSYNMQKIKEEILNDSIQQSSAFTTATVSGAAATSTSTAMTDLLDDENVNLARLSSYIHALKSPNKNNSFNNDLIKIEPNSSSVSNNNNDNINNNNENNLINTKIESSFDLLKSSESYNHCNILNKNYNNKYNSSSREEHPNIGGDVVIGSSELTSNSGVSSGSNYLNYQQKQSQNKLQQILIKEDASHQRYKLLLQQRSGNFTEQQRKQEFECQQRQRKEGSEAGGSENITGHFEIKSKTEDQQPICHYSNESTNKNFDENYKQKQKQQEQQLQNNLIVFNEFLKDIQEEWLHFHPKTPPPSPPPLTSQNDVQQENEPMVEFCDNEQIKIEIQQLSAEPPTSVLNCDNLFLNSPLYETQKFTYNDLLADDIIQQKIITPQDTDSNSGDLSGGDSELNLSLGDDNDNEKMLDNILQECQIDDLKTLNQTTNFWNGILDGSGLDDDVTDVDAATAEIDSGISTKKTALDSPIDSTAVDLLADTKIGYSSELLLNLDKKSYSKKSLVGNFTGCSEFKIIEKANIETFFKKIDTSKSNCDQNEIKIEPPDEILASPPPPPPPATSPINRQIRVAKTFTTTFKDEVPSDLMQNTAVSICNNSTIIGNNTLVSSSSSSSSNNNNTGTVKTPIAFFNATQQQLQIIGSANQTSTPIYLNQNNQVPTIGFVGQQKFYIKQESIVPSCNSQQQQQQQIITLSNVKLENDLNNLSGSQKHTSTVSGVNNLIADADGNVVSVVNTATGHQSNIIMTQQQQQQQQKPQHILLQQIGGTTIVSSGGNQGMQQQQSNTQIINVTNSGLTTLTEGGTSFVLANSSSGNATKQLRQINGPTDRNALQQFLKQQQTNKFFINRKIQISQQQQQQLQQHLKQEDDSTKPQTSNQQIQSTGNFIKLSSYPVVVSELNVVPSHQQSITSSASLSAVAVGNHNYSLQPSAQPITIIGHQSSQQVSTQQSNSTGNKIILNTSAVSSNPNFTITEHIPQNQQSQPTKIHYQQIHQQQPTSGNIKVNLVTNSGIQMVPTSTTNSTNDIIKVQQGGILTLQQPQQQQQQQLPTQQKLKLEKLNMYIDTDKNRLLYTKLVNLTQLQQHNKNNQTGQNIQITGTSAGTQSQILTTTATINKGATIHRIENLQQAALIRAAAAAAAASGSASSGGNLIVASTSNTMTEQQQKQQQINNNSNETTTNLNQQSSRPPEVLTL